jgi:hypothetical protein
LDLHFALACSGVMTGEIEFDAGTAEPLFKIVALTAPADTLAWLKQLGSSSRHDADGHAPPSASSRGGVIVDGGSRGSDGAAGAMEGCPCWSGPSESTPP